MLLFFLPKRGKRQQNFGFFLNKKQFCALHNDAMFIIIHPTTQWYSYRSSSNYIEWCSTPGVTDDLENWSFIGNNQLATSVTEIPNTDSPSSTGTCQPCLTLWPTCCRLCRYSEWNKRSNHVFTSNFCKQYHVEMLKGLPPVKRLRLQSKVLSDMAEAMEPESHSNVAVQSLSKTGESFRKFVSH